MPTWLPASGRAAAFAAGFAAAALLLFAAGEGFLRVFPPADFRPYLGDKSGLSGPFRADDRLCVQYRSWQAFQEAHHDRQTAIDSTRCWAMFGNSFVHMQGMLADTTRAALPDRPVFNLGRNELVFVRAAQVVLLLDHGAKPERVFFVMLPHDAWPLAKHSLSQVRVTPQGGIVYAPRDPGGPVGCSIAHSRLALMTWVRSGRHEGVPSFRPQTLVNGIHPALKADLRQILTNLGEASRRHDVPITVVLIPNYEQITRNAAFKFQNELTATCLECGLDVCDVRRPFLDAADKPGLFIPDKHFSDRGNRLLLGAILEHLGDSGTPTRVTRGEARP